MNMSKMKKPIAKMLIVAMVLSLVPFMQSFVGFAYPETTRLNDFIESIQVYNSDGELLSNDSDLEAGEIYKFIVNFAETSEERFEFTDGDAAHPDDVLLFRLPEQLEVSSDNDMEAELPDFKEVDVDVLITTIHENDYAYIIIDADESPIITAENHDFPKENKFTVQNPDEQDTDDANIPREPLEESSEEPTAQNKVEASDRIFAPNSLFGSLSVVMLPTAQIMYTSNYIDLNESAETQNEPVLESLDPLVTNNQTTKDEPAQEEVPVVEKDNSKDSTTNLPDKDDTNNNFVSEENTAPAVADDTTQNSIQDADLNETESKVPQENSDLAELENNTIVTPDSSETPPNTKEVKTTRVNDIFSDPVLLTTTIKATVSPDAQGVVDFGNGFTFAVRSAIAPLDESLARAAVRAGATSSDLRDFITALTITDVGTGDVVFPPSPANVIQGHTYQLQFTFNEDPTAGLQMAYPDPTSPPSAPTAPNTANPGGNTLSYQLPSSLIIHSFVDTTPVYIGSAIVGWYQITTTGLVSMWFDNVQQDGTPTPNGSNFIDWYSNVSIVFNVYAQFDASTDGDLDFGGDITVNVPPPALPQPRLDFVKQSRYDPTEGTNGTIHYLINITVLDAPATNIILGDIPKIDNSGITEHPSPNAAFTTPIASSLSISADPSGVIPTWNYATNDSSWFMNFGSLIFQPGDVITVRYALDIAQLIANNPLLVPNSISYDFTVTNTASVSGQNTNGEPLPNVDDSTTDHVKKAVTITKSGNVVIDGNTGQILWSVIVGGQNSPALNDGAIYDAISGADFVALTLCADSDINIQFFGSDQSPGASPIWQGTAADLTAAYYVRSPGPIPAAWPGAADQTAWDFGILVPADGTNLGGVTLGNIYRVEITYYTDIQNIPPTGVPDVITNTVTYYPPGGPGITGGGNVTIKVGNVGLQKSTSGLCGRQGEGSGPNGEDYYIDYTINIQVPGGLYGLPLYLYDTLGYMPGGSGILNLPTNALNNLVVQAIDNDRGTPAVPGIQFSLQRYQDNAWVMGFGSTDFSSRSWPYSQAIDLIITYRMFIPNSTIASLSQNTAAYIQNTAYFLNETGNTVHTSGQPLLASANVNDYWPISKEGKPSQNNPSIFDYTVTLRGGYSSTTASTLLRGDNPVFTDNFDTRLEYVPGSLYVARRSTATGPILAVYSVPVGSPAVTYGSGRLSTHFNLLQNYGTSTPPSGGFTSSGNLPLPGWFNTRDYFTVHYQLRMIDGSLLNPGDPALTFNNTASIERNPGTCMFNASAQVTFDAHRLSKSIVNTAEGSNLVHFEVIINQDGSIFFDDGSSPSSIYAIDVLTNLQLYMDTVRFYTKTESPAGSGNWTGDFTVQMPTGFNTHTNWSVNPGTPDNPGTANTVYFVIPNRQPVKITYDALVTLEPGVEGEINNVLSIFGESASDGSTSWTVDDSGAGAQASRQTVRVLKQDHVGNRIKGATFDLYVTNIQTQLPIGGLDPVLLDGLGTVQFGKVLEGIVSDSNGIATFDHELIISRPGQYLFVIHERIPPDGYDIIGSGYTFFTIAQNIPPMQLMLLSQNLGITPDQINSISDFVPIENQPLGHPGSLRVVKQFVDGNGYTIPNNILEHNLSNFQIIITDSVGQDHVFSLADALSPDGIVLKDIEPGWFFFRESGADNIPGFRWKSDPDLSNGYRRRIFPSDQGAVTVMITNEYSAIDLIVAGPQFPLMPGYVNPEVPSVPSSPSPGGSGHSNVPQTGDNNNPILWIGILSASIIGLAGIMIWKRFRGLSKNEKEQK